jgi:hypothetical protein
VPIQLYPSSTIRYAKIDGLYVLLDLLTANYFLLNETASRMWESFLGIPCELPCASKDLQDFVKNCIDRQFLSTQPPKSRREDPRSRRITRSGRPFLLWRALTSLIGTAVSMRINGFSSTYLSYAKCGSPVYSGCASATVLRAQEAFLKAEEFFWYWRAPADCLPRSLALFRFLRSLGMPALHRIGGRRVPTFSMHAWVELDGMPLLENQSSAERYTVLATIPWDASC